MYLAIDTITAASGITVFDESNLSHQALNPKMASEGIIETIDKTLKEAGAALADLRGVFVIKGPGSFTGLRVGISVANQFAHQLKIPIVGLRTDEFWHLENPGVTYIQPMNREEVFMSDENGPRIAPKNELSDAQQNFEARFMANTWEKAPKAYEDQLSEQKVYDLVEPFYGKKPNITKSKKQISLG